MGKLILQSIEKALLRKRGYVFKVPKKKDIVFLVSGGLDSIVSIDKVIREWGVKIYPLFIKRGARAEKFEEQAFDYFANFYAKRFPMNFKQPCKIKTEIPPLRLKSCFSERTLGTLGYPMRDANLQNIGIQYAASLNEMHNLNIKTIIIAMSPDETFPHCSVLALRIQTLLVCVDRKDWSWQITSPLIEPTLGKPFYKRDLVLWAARYDIPVEKTRTCISGRKIPDGTCPECLWRIKAFKSARIKHS